MIPQEGLQFEYKGQYFLIIERYSVTMKYKNIKTGQVISSTVDKFLQNEKNFNFI